MRLATAAGRYHPDAALQVHGQLLPSGDTATAMEVPSFTVMVTGLGAAPSAGPPSNSANARQ